MFVLTQMKDTVRIQPNLFNLDPNEAIINVLNQKFANKVSALKVTQLYDKSIKYLKIIKCGNAISCVKVAFFLSAF